MLFIHPFNVFIKKKLFHSLGTQFSASNGSHMALCLTCALCVPTPHALGWF